MPAAWFNATTSIEGHGTAQQTAVIGIAPRAVMLDGYWRDIASVWEQGDGDLPHLVSQAPIRVGTADSGRRRLYPVPGDLSRYIEIGAPLIKPAGSWVSVGFSGATRQANRITWSRPQANLSIVHGGHFCKLDIELRGGYVPPNRQFAFPVALVGLTRSGARIMADGVPVMLLRPPVVYDAANPQDSRPIDWQFGAIGGQTGVLFTLPSLVGMARPVVDPTLALQPDATAGTDNYLDGAVATANNGTSASLDAIMSATAGIRRMLLQFSLTSLPGGANVSLATLALVCRATLAAGQVNVHALTRAWTEAGSTWNTYDGTNNWTTAGGDYSATVSGSLNPASWDLNTAYSFTITDLVKSWLTGSNLGCLLKLATETGTSLGLAAYSSDHTTANQRPLLTVTYTLAGGGIGRGRHGVLGRL